MAVAVMVTATTTAMATAKVTADGGNGDSHGGDGCSFLGVANLIEARKANHPNEDAFHCTCNHFDQAQFRRILDGGV